MCEHFSDHNIVHMPGTTESCQAWLLSSQAALFLPIFEAMESKHVGLTRLHPCTIETKALGWSTRPWQKFNLNRIGLHKVRSVLPLLSKIWSRSKADWSTFRGHSRYDILFIMP